MNLRSRAIPVHPGIQLAPLVDVLLLLLIFFLLTWNAARNENELDVKVPKASAATEKSAPIGDVVVNVKADGNVVVNRRTLSEPELTELLKSLVQLNSEQAVVIRGEEGGPSDQRQLDYANGLFTRKLYDLAAPEYQKYLDDFPGRPGRANAYFSLGECYRNLNRVSSARANLQKVLNDYGDSEFAGPAAYALAEIAFADKDYATALPL